MNDKQMPLPTLNLALKAEYFNAIKDGSKVEEYRLCTPYWEKRLGVHRHYGSIVLTLGYPSKTDHSRRIVKPWVATLSEPSHTLTLAISPLRCLQFMLEHSYE